MISLVIQKMNAYTIKNALVKYLVVIPSAKMFIFYDPRDGQIILSTPLS